jgi:hypothetical protein
MPRKADKPDFPGLLRGHHGLKGTIPREETIWIFHADVFVALDQVDMIGLEPPQGFIDLLRRCFPGAAIEFCHEKHLLAVSVAKSYAHAPLALAFVVVPAIVHECYSAVDRGSDDPNAFSGIFRATNVMTAQPNCRNTLAGATERSIDHGPSFGCCRQRHHR